MNKTFKLVVSNGKVKVYYNGTEVCSGDDATPATSGLFGAYVAYSTKVVVSSINATTSSKKASFLLDKKFSSETDTLASLGTDGFNLTNIDSVGTNGLVGKTDKKQSIKFTTKFGGVYTAELEGIIGWKPVHFRVNVNDDGTSYYDIYNDAGTLMIDKVTADSTTTLSSKTAQSTYLSEDNTLKYIVSLAPQDTGDMNIDVTAMINDAVIDTLSATDAAVDVPLTDGYVQYYSEYSKSTIKSMKVYPGVTPVSYTGDFYVNGTTTAAKGHTIMTFPVAMLGQTPDVIAALYEDGKVTDVEFINIADLNNKGYAELFDTASSTANKVNVKVFIWDTLEGLIPVTEAFSLVK